MRLTYEEVPFRNSCNVLAEVARTGVSSARILLSRQEVNDQHLLRRARSIPRSEDLTNDEEPVILNVEAGV
jgi:hypothetical protein